MPVATDKKERCRKALIKDIWLSNEVFEWERFTSCNILINKDLCQRSYEIWGRASSLIEKIENQFDLIDGIANLKRSLNHRLLLIEDTYHFKNINFQNKPKHYLELLECFNLVRPYIMKELMEIRNEIEHNDTNPPEQKECKKLVDVVWYFLKSTDTLVQSLKTDVDFELLNSDGKESKYIFSITIDYTNLSSFKLRGWFPSDMMSLEEKDNFFSVSVIQINGKEKFLGSELHQDKLDTDRWIECTVNTDRVNYKDIVKNILSSY